MGSMQVYAIGSAVNVSVTFKDQVTDLPADPTTVKLRVMNPFEVEAIYTALSHPSLGRYQFILYPLIPGIWKYRFEGVGAVVAAGERRFEVIYSSFDPPF